LENGGGEGRKKVLFEDHDYDGLFLDNASAGSVNLGLLAGATISGLITQDTKSRYGRDETECYAEHVESLNEKNAFFAVLGSGNFTTIRDSQKLFVIPIRTP